MTELYSKKDMYLDVCETIGQVGKSLVTMPNEPVVLKRLSERLPALSKYIGDKHLVLLSSYLKPFTDDLWFNIMTDNSAKLSTDSRDQLLKNIGTTLVNLSNSLKKKKVGNIYSCYATLGELWNNIPSFEEGKFSPGIPQPGDDEITSADKNAVLNCENVLSSGMKSAWNYDIDRRLCTAKQVEKLSDQYVERIRGMKKRGLHFDKLAFIDKDYGPVGAISLMSLIVKETKIDPVIVRLRRRTAIGQIKCDSIKQGDSILIINDVLTTGDGIIKAANLLRKTADVSHALVYLDRSKDAPVRLKQEGIEVEAIKRPSDVGVKESELRQAGGDELFPIISK